MKDLKLALMSVQSRYREPRKRDQQGRGSELSRVSRDRHARHSLDIEPASLLYAEDTPAFYRATLAKNLFGAGLDAPVRDNGLAEHIHGGSSNLTGTTTDGLLLEDIARYEHEARKRLAQTLDSNSALANFKLTEENLRDFRDVWQLSEWIEGD